MTDEQLSNIFKRDLPEHGQGPWADDARRRHSRRRAAIGGVSGLAVVAIATPIALMLGGNGGSAVPVPAGPESTSPQPLAPASRDAACSGAAESAVEELPQTAARLWLCDEPGGGLGLSRQGPEEPLTQGVDEALAAFHGLEKLPPDIACTEEYTMSYVVVAEGADGTYTPVMGGLHGCRQIGDRAGAGEYLDTLAGLWNQQRAGQTPPADGVDTGQLCASPYSILPAAVDDVTHGALCTMPEGTSPVGVEIPADTVRLIREDIAENVADGVPGEWEPVANLVLGNPWGDSVALTRFPSGIYATGDGIWRPTGELAATLDLLLEQLTLPTPQPPEQGATDCSAARSAVDATGGTIDGEVAHVSICVENREDQPRWKAPDTMIIDPAKVRQAVAAFNDLPPLAGECTDTARADIFVEYHGADGLVAAVRAASCGPTTGAVAKDGAGFVEQIVELTRDVNLPAVQHLAADQYCPQLDSLVKFDPVEEPAVRAVACLGEAAEVAVELSPELVSAMADAVSGEPSADSGEPVTGTLIWISATGDPMTMIGEADGSFTWTDADGGPRRWTPTGEVKAELDQIFTL